MLTRIKNAAIIPAILAGAAAWAATESSWNPAIPEMTIAPCRAAPKIDGILDDDCWAAAAPTTNFNIVGEAGKITHRHQAWVTFDQEWLYVAFAVAHPASDRNPPVYRKHDETVQRENNVQVSFDPGTGGKLYYQFLVNPANVRADFRMTLEKGRERENWNIPWRSATHADDAGWTAEIALPWCLLLTHGEINQARLNLIVVTHLPIRDKQAVQLGTQRKKTSWAPLRTNFHEPEQFGLLRGIQDTEFKAPFLPFIHSAAVQPYHLENGRYAYNIALAAQSLSSRTGMISLAVTDQPEGAPPVETAWGIPLPGDCEQAIKLAVPADTLVKRTAAVRLVDPRNGEEWQRILVDETSVLDLFSCYLDRNYYTTEDAARVICRIALPPEGLQGMSLVAKNADGKTLAEAGALSPEHTLAIPLRDLPTGKQTVAVELRQAGGQTATRQELQLVKRAPRPGCEWKIDRENRVLLDNGRPFFPYGFIMANLNSSHEWALRDVGSNGFNAVFQWGRTPPDGDFSGEGANYLDLAQRYNVRVVLAPDVAYPGGNETIADPDGILSAEEIADVNKTLAMHRSGLTSFKGMLVSNPHLRKLAIAHKGRLYFQLYEKLLPHFTGFIQNAIDRPNLIGFYILDEPLVMEINQDITGRHFYNHTHATDGYHPVFVLYSSEIPETPRATDWCDALGTDPYWIPAADRRSTVNWVSKVVANTRRRADEVRAVTFTVPMAEYWSACRKRVILPREQRCQTYLSLIHGSRGIFYFLYPVVSQPVFDELKILAREMQTLGPICLTPDVAQQADYAPGELDLRHDKFTDVQVALKRNPAGGYVLLAANTAPYPVDTTFTISLLGESGAIKRLFGDEVYPVSRQSFQERLAGFDTRAYLIPEPALAADAAPSAAAPVVIKVQMVPQLDGFQPETPARLELDRKGKKNLLPNSSFEQTSVAGWPDYYRYTGTPIMPDERIGGPTPVFGADARQAYHGRHSLFLEGNTNAHRIAYIEPIGLRRLTDQARPFVFSAWMRANRNGVRARVRIGLVLSKKEVDLTTEWQRVSLSAVIPVKADETVIWLHNDKNQNGDCIWIDAIQFETGDQPTDYEP